METAKIRQLFVDFFLSHNHQLVRSSSLIPQNDPTLLFTNAGMNQFKNIFLGFEPAPSKRVVTVQKCMRAGGKHNDLENVGYTARHHTFFEMLGNFSFGDYFKQDAIRFAWTFLTASQWLHLPLERLFVTVYAPDEESYQIWHQDIGLPDHKIIRIGDQTNMPYVSDNFWQMGDTGPCGPCTEIFYDHGESIAGGLPGSMEESGDRFTEIWNCVFMQFNRDAAGMHPLPNPSVDTGMGLERIAAVMQGVHSNFETDAFQALITSAKQAIETTTSGNNTSFCVIADHIRAATFLIGDGVLPANDGAGYVLRRIIRRASRHGYQLGQKQPFLHNMVEHLVSMMAVAYPELVPQQPIIKQTIFEEENRFAETLERGMTLLETAMQQSAKNKLLPGETVFLLYDTFGFPVDLTADICKAQGIKIDQTGFDQAMQRQRQQSQQYTTFKSIEHLAFDGQTTCFEGYQNTQAQGTIIGLFKSNQPVKELLAKEAGIVVLDRTPFYAESGGQIGDCGTITQTHHQGIFEVSDTQKIKAAVFGHHGVVTEGALRIGDTIFGTIDSNRRQHIAKNHSVTHLLHAALKQILGSHVAQKGSLITEAYSRFDFAHTAPVSIKQREAIENLVNQIIVENHPITITNMAFEEAMRQNITALFNEKYGQTVRVLAMGTFSRELCGGTHVNRTGEIGLFKITNEYGVAAGIRRIEAITGNAALLYTQQQQQLIAQIANQLKANVDNEILDKLNSLRHQLKITEKALNQTTTKLASSTVAQLVKMAKKVANTTLLTAELEEESTEILRQMIDQLKTKFDNAIIVLASHQYDKTVLIMVGITSNLTHRFHAGKLVQYLAQQLVGKGGGRAELAQVSCQKTPQFNAVLHSIETWMVEQN